MQNKLCQAALRRLKLGISLEKADDGWEDERNEGLCCSAVLNTKSLDKKTGKRANLGFLANVFLEKGKLTVTVRSANEAFSGILATHLVNMLSGNIQYHSSFHMSIYKENEIEVD